MATQQVIGNFVPADEMIALVTRRGYRAEPVVADTVPSRVVGYTLRGPRGTKTVICTNPAGLVDLDAAKLWCDGVDYGTAKRSRRRA